MTLTSGSLLNKRYRIKEILGHGGMGSIYKAVDENLGVDVAVKENLFTTEEYARQFRLEAVILANLRHVNLPRVSDHFVIDEQGQYLVMDYIMGEDLREQMDRQGEIPELDILNIGICICDALTYMHSRKPPVLHRDIKPGNVRITPLGEIYLVDFGLAKFVQKDQQTSTGARAMTPGYSPPEQYGAARTDNRSDIYSLGATMYAALVGNIPEDSLARTMDQAKLTLIRKRNKKISKLTAAVVEKALEVQPSDRYQSADEFKKDLKLSKKTSFNHLPVRSDQDQDLEDVINEDFVLNLEDTPVFSSGSTEVEVTRFAEEDQRIDTGPRSNIISRFFRDRRIIFALIAAVILLAFGVGVMTVFSPDFPGDIFTISSSQKTAVLGDEGTPSDHLETISTGGESTVQKLLDGPDLTQKNKDGIGPLSTHTDTSSAVLIDTPSPKKTDLPIHTPIGGGTGQIAFSSDRTGLPQIWVIDVDNTDLYRVTDAQGGACQPDWSPDGLQLVYTSPCDGDKETYQGSGLFIINADGTNPTPLPVQGLGDYDPSWSPDGRYIAFTSLRKSDRPQILLWDLINREVVVLSKENFRDLQPSWSSDGSLIVFVSSRNGPYQIWTMNADGSNQLRFSVSGSLKDTKPVFSHDDRLLVFNQSKGPGSIPHLQGALFPEGAEQEYTLVNAGVKPMKDADFSFDGLWIILESWPDGAMHDLYLMATSGGDFIQVTMDPALDFDPVWRPGK